MDLTQGTDQEKLARAKKMMLWFGIVSLIMSFAGWTSAFIVSSTRKDWLSDFVLPQPFLISVFVIIASSITLVLSKRALKDNKLQMATAFLILTFALGIYFIVNQFNGFNEIVAQGYHFTGPTSNVTMSYIFLIAFVHIMHVAVGLICLLVVLINQFRNKYNPENMLGFELAATFRHFVDILWVYLFFFLYFFK
jgi:cytochrome c oxidase subunit 3